MNLFRLEEPVSITGPDYFGRKSNITFSPTLPHKRGFFWKYDPVKPSIHISEAFASTFKRRMALTCENAMLNIYEHIGVIRWAGLDGIEISSSQWPPYHGRPLEIYQALFEKSVQTAHPLRWCTTSKSIQQDYPGSMKRYTALIPSEKPGLEVIIICEYPGLGKKELHYSWSQDLIPAFSAHSQGWPQWAYYPARIAKFFGWPHAEHIDWPQNHHEQKTLDLFCMHRLVDLLGDISLFHSTRFFAGTIISHCSGHWADLQLAKRAQAYIYPLNNKELEEQE